MIKVSQVAEHYHKLGKKFDSRTIADDFGITCAEAGRIINNIEKAKQYKAIVKRDGRKVLSVQVMEIAGRVSHYRAIRAYMKQTARFMSADEIATAWGIRRDTAAHMLMRMRKDPTIETEQKEFSGGVVMVRIKTPEVELSKEDKLWRVLTTKHWSEMFNGVAA